jgi:hypothetical protein
VENIVPMFRSIKLVSDWTGVCAFSRPLLVAIFLSGIGAATAADNQLLRYVGDWQLFINQNNTCAIGVAMREPDKSILNFIISLPDAGSLNPNDPLLPIQIDVQDNRIAPKPEAAQKKAVLYVGDVPSGGAIITVSEGRIILLFFSRSEILSQLSKIGALRMSSDYFNLNFPFKPLRDQISALAECERARKSQ